MKLSVVIPSYKDPLLHKTIDSLLENSELGNDIEIIPVIDGYTLEKPIRNDPRIRVLQLEKTHGMRGAINAGVAAAKGEYILRTDEHATFSKGYDRVLLENIEDNWIVTPRRYLLDVEKWEVMPDSPVDYGKLVIQDLGGGHKKFTANVWRSRARERRKIMIDETMGMQGSCWIMKKSWWEKVIVELQSEGYGTHYQDSMEMVFKTWKAGGKLMVNKNAWHAHKHRKFPRTHSYGGAEAEACFAYSLSVWKDYYEKEIKPKWGI